MNSLSSRPAELARRLDALAERMNVCDVELAAAERRGDVTAQIALYFERSTLWKSYSDVLTEGGKEAHTALFCARTDRRAALTLQAKVEGI